MALSFGSLGLSRLNLEGEEEAAIKSFVNFLSLARHHSAVYTRSLLMSIVAADATVGDLRYDASALEVLFFDLVEGFMPNGPAPGSQLARTSLEVKVCIHDMA